MKLPLILLALAISATCEAEVVPGSADAAQAMAGPYVANRFISVAKPEISGDQALVRAMFNGQECTLNLLRDPSDQSKSGWRIYAGRCRAQAPGDVQKWYAEQSNGMATTEPPADVLAH